jgi:CoA:oxalate CoA-transferase
VSEPAGGAGPLRGLRVLDLTTFLSGPFCTQILADLGAEVIKLESLDGDPSRHIPPYFVGGESAYYLSHNRGKRSIAVDLKTPRGQALARDLAVRSDVVVENFRPGVAARLGLAATALQPANPALVWVSISGFGQRGPWRDRPAYDLVVQALSGVMSLTGHPGTPAARLGVPAGDLVAGLYAALAALAALVERSRTGTGAVADISMLDGQLSMLSYQAVYAAVGGITPGPQGGGHDSIPTYRTFRGGDARELVVTANTQRMWVDLCEVLGLSPLAADERFATPAARLSYRGELGPLLEAAFLGEPAEVWVRRLLERSVPAALIKTVPEALADARAADRGMVRTLRDGAGHAVPTVATPILFDGRARAVPVYPPRLGEHTAAVLRELGAGPAEIDRLIRDGVVAGPAAPPAAPSAAPSAPSAPPAGPLAAAPAGSPAAPPDGSPAGAPAPPAGPPVAAPAGRPRIRPPDPARLTPELRSALAALPPLPHFGVLAHAETAFLPRQAYGEALRCRLALPADLRELAILRTAHLTDCDYIVHQHRAPAAAAGLAGPAIEAALADPPDPATLTAPQAAVVGLVGEMVTRRAGGAAGVRAVLAHLTQRELVELCLVVERYLVLSVVLNTLGVAPGTAAHSGVDGACAAPE